MFDWTMCCIFQLTNQLVCVCKNHLRQPLITDGEDSMNEEDFWQMIDQEIATRDLKEFGDPHCRQFKSLLETRLVREIVALVAQ